MTKLNPPVSVHVLAFVALMSLSARAALFTGLGDLPGGTFDSACNCAVQIVSISGDGSTIVGRSRSEQWLEAFRWTVSDGMHGLGSLPLEDRFGFFSTGQDVNADGSVVVGRSLRSDEELFGEETFRWTKSGGMESLGWIDGYNGDLSLSRWGGVSDAGDVVVGSILEFQPEDFRADRIGAFLWTQENGMLDLGAPDEFDTATNHSALDISGDGTVVLGKSRHSGFNGQSGLWRWTAANRFELIAETSRSSPHLWANDISPDGSAIVGYEGTQNEFSPFRWTEIDGLVNLDGWSLDVFGGIINTAVTDDGSTVVGSSFPDANAPSPSFIWDEVNGMRDLRELLSSEYGLGEQLEGWTGLLATDISGDGRRIVGGGINPLGNREAWLVILSETNTQGDFDGNDNLTAADIDFLSVQVRSQSDGQRLSPAFDLNDDAMFDQEDRRIWVEDFAQTSFGDADLNNIVEFDDFLSLASSFNMAGGWAEGDFDGDGTVLFPDFLLLASHFGESTKAVAVVPEPSAGLLLLAGFVSLGRRRRPFHREMFDSAIPIQGMLGDLASVRAKTGSTVLA